MKITRMPNNSQTAARERVVIVREESNGCLLAFVIFVCIVAALLLVFFGVPFVIAHSSSRQDLESPGKSATAVTPDARASALQSQSETSSHTTTNLPSRAQPVSTTSKAAKPTALPGELANWIFQKSVDEMTDETAYFFSLEGEHVDINELTGYMPKLVIKITPQSVLGGVPTYSHDVAIMIETEGFHRDVQEVMIRLDSLEPLTGGLKTSTSRRAVFLPKSALKSLDGSKRLALRFTTTLGAVRTLKFDLDGFKLDDLEAELIKRVRADRPKGVEIAP